MQRIGEPRRVLHVISEVNPDAGAGHAGADRADVACVAGAAEGVEELVDGGIELHDGECWRVFKFCWRGRGGLGFVVLLDTSCQARARLR